MGIKSLVYGVGINDVDYNVSEDKEYRMWQKMLSRCFDSKTKQRQPSYLNVTCCDEWFIFSNFIKDIRAMANYEMAVIESWQLDKDILIKGNNIYSKENCCFVPQEINKLLVSRARFRGEYPIGVSLIKGEGRYRAQLSVDGRQVHLGRFASAVEAFECYKKAKQHRITKVANNFKSVISSDVYSALICWDVSIDD